MTDPSWHDIRHSYDEIYRRFLELRDIDGVPSASYKVSDGVDVMMFPNSLDLFILKLFDCDDRDDKLDCVHLFTTRLLNGAVDVRWLYGEHAATLLKAKMIQRGMVDA